MRSLAEVTGLADIVPQFHSYLAWVLKVQAREQQSENHLPHRAAAGACLSGRSRARATWRGPLPPRGAMVGAAAGS